MADDFSLADKSVLVTGASSGIGRVLAETLAHEGAKVFATGRSRERLNEVMEGLSGEGHGSALADLTDPDQVAALAEAAPELNGIVLNAGILSKLRPFPLEDLANTKAVMDVNFFGPMNLLNQLVKKKKIANGASIVFITAASAMIGPPASSAYSASKAALTAFSKSVANDLGRKKVRSNCVCCGYVKTDALANINVTNDILEMVPFGVAAPADVMGPILFLLSDASQWITRTSFIVDGGLTLKQSRLL